MDLGQLIVPAPPPGAWTGGYPQTRNGAGQRKSAAHIADEIGRVNHGPAAHARLPDPDTADDVSLVGYCPRPTRLGDLQVPASYLGVASLTSWQGSLPLRTCGAQQQVVACPLSRPGASVCGGERTEDLLWLPGHVRVRGAACMLQDRNDSVRGEIKIAVRVGRVPGLSSSRRSRWRALAAPGWLTVAWEQCCV